MRDEPMNPAHMDLHPGSRMTACPPGGDVPQPVIESGASTCRAPFPGPATFRLPIVLPKTAEVTGARLRARGSGPATVRLSGREIQGCAAEAGADACLDAALFAGGRDFEIPELDFRDFVRHDLEVTVQAPADRPAELTLEGRLDYLLPVESAAAYLTYVMTQA